ncbi:hypothetical protein P389DRAFT_171038 [Cystobasidium minutum MCA 4210]|uniref:uncharacterized protein n=1 Tax=Cystobasidium minutum MCA 4210 TaxID=1397322 RepID=UPI0034CFF2AE|eukprot:jgi/Rhomi1/171038/fgenesh1_kg.4_\
MPCFATENARERFLSTEIWATLEATGDEFDTEHPALEDKALESQRQERRYKELAETSEEEASFSGLLTTFRNKISLKMPFYFCVSCPPKSGSAARDRL